MAVYSRAPLKIERRRQAGGALEVVKFDFADWTVLGLYRSPDRQKAPLPRLLDELEALLPQEAGKRVVVVGDFNVDLNLRESSDKRQLEGWMRQRHFDYSDIGPTTELQTAIDHVWSNSPLSGPTMAITSYYSDHKKILVTFPSE